MATSELSTAASAAKERESALERKLREIESFTSQQRDHIVKLQKSLEGEKAGPSHTRLKASLLDDSGMVAMQLRGISSVLLPAES